MIHLVAVLLAMFACTVHAELFASYDELLADRIHLSDLVIVQCSEYLGRCLLLCGATLLGDLLALLGELHFVSTIAL